MPPSEASLSKQEKLLTAAQFKAVLSKRNSIHGRLFSIHTAVTLSDCPRMGITVSRKVSKKAVQRNRIKRQIRESFRLGKTALLNKDFVIIAKIGCAKVENSVIREELVKLWAMTNRK